MIFTQELIKRFKDLILECISFKFMIFILILMSVGNTNIPYVSEIVSALAGTGTLAYKYYKDSIGFNKSNFHSGGEQ